MEISLSTNEFKALSSESRTKILKLLDERNYTLSELSSKTGMAAPTIKQHATILMGSGLIELKDEGRKWKYYTLTRKGRELISAQKSPGTNILIILSTTVLVAALGVALIFSSLNLQYSANAGSAEYDARNAIEPLNSTAAGKNIPGQQAAKTKSCTGAFTIGSRGTDNPYAGIPADQDAALECAYANTEQECLAIDKWNTDTNSKVVPDGRPDCKWE